MTDPSQLNDLFYQAGTLMLVGMAFVYAFLMLMIFVIQKIITPLGKKYGYASAPPLPQANTGASSETPPQIIAAVSAAIKQYRTK